VLKSVANFTGVGRKHQLFFAGRRMLHGLFRAVRDYVKKRFP
jgi:hypothetical protein